MALRIYIDMDDVLCDYSTAHQRDLVLYPDVEYPQSRRGFYEELMPIQGALKAASALACDPRFEVYILTAPSIYNPLCYTEKRLWVEAYLGFDWCDRLIICPDKSLLIGDILIDDRTHGHDQNHFVGNLVQFGSVQFPDWKAIAAHFEL